MHFKTIQPDNPVLRAEINYQQRIVPRWLQWFDRFGVIVVALIISLVLLIFPIMDDRYGTGGYLYGSMHDPLLVLLWISQFIVIFRCVFVGANAMQHHNGPQENDIIVLTGISRKQVLTGRYWATLYQLRGWIIAFGIIKLATFAFVILSLTIYCYRSPMDSVIRQLRFYGGRTPPLDWALGLLQGTLPRLPDTSRILLAGIHIPTIAILEIMVSSAIGIVGGLLPQKVIGLIVAILLRFIPIINFSLRPDYPHALGYFLWRWYEYTLFSLVDGGSSGILRAGLFFRSNQDVNQITLASLLAFWTAIIMFIAYLVFAFLISNFLLRRQGFLSVASK